ncbi:MAG: hypothetical protein DRJ18_00665 [Candidatus Methanomethylicota archaeon]|nr:MAG: hypothetical protein DRJ18_00665 [Candidatus Verstraetearchaeota archaeon]
MMPEAGEGWEPGATEEARKGKAKLKVLRVFESVVFDPERGPIRVVTIRFEYPPGHLNEINIPKEEYTPEIAKERLKEWVEKYGPLFEEFG